MLDKSKNIDLFSEMSTPVSLISLDLDRKFQDEIDKLEINNKENPTITRRNSTRWGNNIIIQNYYFLNKKI